MERFVNILFPIDFSEHCATVAPAIFAMARRFHATVTLLHVIERATGVSPEWTAYLQLVDVESIRRFEERRLNHFLIDASEGIEIKRVLLEGEPAATIVEYAKNNAIDLIALPSRGLSRFHAFIMGSVTERVLHDAACPVWTEAHLDEEATPPSVYHSVLCCVDLSPASAGVVRWAARFASEYGASLHVIHAESEDLDDSRRRLRALLRDTSVEAEYEAYRASLPDTVQVTLTDYRADLLVVGRGHSQAKLSRLRTHLAAIIRETPCPVLSV